MKSRTIILVTAAVVLTSHANFVTAAIHDINPPSQLFTATDNSSESNNTNANQEDVNNWPHSDVPPPAMSGY